MRESLGSDSRNPGKVIGIGLFAMLLVSFLWFSANATLESQVVANFYTTMGLLVLVVVAVDQVLKNFGGSGSAQGAGQGGDKAELPDTVTYEDESPFLGKLPHMVKVLIAIGAFLYGGWYFLQLGGQETLSIIASPTFQLIEVGPVGNAFLSGAAGIAEDLLFFGVVGPTIFAIATRLTKLRAVGAGVTFFATPIIFMLYHLSRYGDSPVALDSVLLFGFFGTTIMLILGNLLAVHAVHFANNAGIAFFASTSADLTGLFMIYVFVVLVVGGIATFRG